MARLYLQIAKSHVLIIAGRRVVRDAAKGGARGAAKPERPPQPSKGAAQGAGEERSSGFMSRPLWLGVGFGAVAG